ncbi:MAG: competence/damage-inducible protein A [Sulfurovum sp.]|nr:MAG: competence/damage-inducible protein A [Sulfurovum sp.]
MKTPNFYLLIIGTEILNQRRIDKHFDFVAKILAPYGHKIKGSFVIEDDPKLIVESIKFLASQENSIIFSFGGIGSTPDDYTRLCASMALSDGKLYTHEEARDIIIETRGKQLNPHSLKMAKLPKNAILLKEPYPHVPAFYLEDRFFFMAGFPHMSHPFVEWIVKNFFATKQEYFTKVLSAKCKESDFIDIMEQLPSTIELSSLPRYDEKSHEWSVTIHLKGVDQKEVNEAFERFISRLETEAIDYHLNDESNLE